MVWVVQKDIARKYVAGEGRAGLTPKWTLSLRAL
jgi:hypothetical protein